jgi:hypothetical protein
MTEIAPLCKKCIYYYTIGYFNFCCLDRITIFDGKCAAMVARKVKK